MASWAYLAYIFADDSIEPAKKKEKAGVFVTSPEFHRIMMRAGDYSIQFDTNAEGHYDSNGIGRFQRAGAPPVVALSSPCPSRKPNFKLDIDNPGPLAISPMWNEYNLALHKKEKVVLGDGKSLWITKLNRKGLKMRLKGEGDQLMTLPAFAFDGETASKIECDGRTLTIAFKGWCCRYTTNGKITDSGLDYANRNGHLRRFDATAPRRLVIKAKIVKDN